MQGLCSQCYKGNSCVGGLMHACMCELILSGFYTLVLIKMKFVLT